MLTDAGGKRATQVGQVARISDNQRGRTAAWHIWFGSEQERVVQAPTYVARLKQCGSGSADADLPRCRKGFHRDCCARGGPGDQQLSMRRRITNQEEMQFAAVHAD